MGYDGTLTFDTKIDSSGFQGGVDKISSLAGNYNNMKIGFALKKN